MLPRDQIENAVEIQQKSYKLLLWLADAIDRGFITFTRAHDYSSAADVAYEWIEEHYHNLPEAGRPPRKRLREFSNYFGSYVTTSFDLVDKPGTRLESSCGCLCPFCAHLVSASHLRPKKLRKRDKDIARGQRTSRLIMLAEEEGIQIHRDTAAMIADDPAFLRNAAYSAYALSLLERIRGDEGGPYALALWREIAWKPEGSPIKGFQLQADNIVDAERQLIAEMKRRPNQRNEPMPRR
jgi:hypothetical protein